MLNSLTDQKIPSFNSSAVIHKYLLFGPCLSPVAYVNIIRSHGQEQSRHGPQELRDSSRCQQTPRPPQESYQIQDILHSVSQNQHQGHGRPRVWTL